jgi:hypothetical protein
MQKLSFTGTRQVKVTAKKRTKSVSCTNAVYSKLFGKYEKIKEMNTMYYEEKIPMS